MKMRDIIQLLESEQLPINIGGVDDPAHWTGNSAPEDADPQAISDADTSFSHSGYGTYAEIGVVGGKRAWIVSEEDGEEAKPRLWTEGRCAAFAQAMNRLYGLPIWAILEYNDTAAAEGVDDPYDLYSLIHAFVVAGTTAIDEKGARPLTYYTEQNGERIVDDDRFFSDDECSCLVKPVTVSELESFHENPCHSSTAALRHIRTRKPFYDAIVQQAQS